MIIIFFTITNCYYVSLTTATTRDQPRPMAMTLDSIAVFTATTPLTAMAPTT